MARRFDLRLASVILGTAVCIAATAIPNRLTYAKLVLKPTVDFNRDVRPIFAQHCWVCHGADKDALAKTGNMKLDTFDGATADRGGYRAITPGKPDKSKLIDRVAAKDPDELMPPASSGIKPLSQSEIATIRKWIEEGAEYRQHWAFVPPKLTKPPAISNPSWAKNDVDRFVLAKLDEEHLKPESEADKRTLIRRVTLTLTGLPPTPEEIEAFLQDKRPDAYEKLVDRLLANPHFGENQARYWLDAVRYADTHGLHIDNERAIFPYRDWVVRAYNEDLPYNQFAEWQLAGDLLPNPTTEQKIATGYIRLNPTTNEGGAIEAEFLAKNTMDRVDTTATVFLGVTLQCAKCHDHKYDPFSQRDYYSMYAFFDSTKDSPLDGNQNAPEPAMKAPTPEQSRQIAILQTELQRLASKVPPEEAKTWALAQADEVPTASHWEINGPYQAKDFDTAFATPNPPEPNYVGKAPIQPWRPFAGDLEKPLTGIASMPNSAGYFRTTISVRKATKIDLRLGSDDGIRVWLNGVKVHENKILRSLGMDDTASVNLKAGENELLVEIVNATGGDGAFVGFGGEEFQRKQRAAMLAKKTSNAQEADEIVRVYMDYGSTSPGAAAFRKIEAAKRDEEAAIPLSLIAQETMAPRPTFVLKRGQYDLPGDPVTRAIPTVFGTIPANGPKNRLGLAQWIIDPKNPLTARVMVNRIWQQHFGTGIVKSSEDFGSRGDWPTNPELLDYLAARFVNEGWSIKKLTRLIVTSAAFRQSAVTTEAKRLKDPENLLASRGPRFRLDAEVIRDSALAESGLLTDTIGGHDDKPYQPAGLWEIIAYPISDTAHYKQDHGEALYRRSLYLFWKRTSPPPMMLTLDAPMRESCVVRRSRTNTPTQALVTLNETGFFEDARAMAQRLLHLKRTNPERLDYAFRLATGRSPSPQEAKIIESYLNEQLARYKQDPKQAAETLNVGESKRDTSLPAPDHAAWTLTCNMILNLDEALTQH